MPKTKKPSKKSNKQHAVKGASFTHAAAELRHAMDDNPPITPWEAVLMVCRVLEAEGKRVRHLR